MKSFNVSPTKNVLKEVFTQVMSSSVITRDEQEQIRRILLSDYLDDDEYAMIETLVDGVSRGLIKFVE